MTRFFKAFRTWLSAFLGDGLATLLRNNILLAVVVFLLTHSGGWKYFASTITAYDARLAAHWSSAADVQEQPLVIAIDDRGYRSFFEGQSPVSRLQMLALLRVIQEHTPAATRVAIDIDLSPGFAALGPQQALDAFWLEQPGKWVLPAVQGGSPEAAAALQSWREALCARGVGFGLPYVPTEFGSPRLTHQYAQSLADALVRPGTPCADPELPPVQKPMPLSAAALARPDVMLFQGDLPALARALDERHPKAVVLGGFWGLDDRFLTPLGERYGVQLHAAAVGGVWRGEHLDSGMGSTLLQLGFMAFMSWLLNGLSRRLDKLGLPMGTGAGMQVPSLHFWQQAGKPLILSAALMLSLLACVLLNGYLHAWTGLWVSPAAACTAAPLVLALAWNYGRTVPPPFKDVRSAWEARVTKPWKENISSLRRSIDLLRTPTQPAHWDGHESSPLLPRWRVRFELVAALTSLLIQNGMPWISISYMVYKMVR